MPTAKVRNLENKEIGDVELSDAVFGVELNESLIHAAVRNYLANRRQGNFCHENSRKCFGFGQKAVEAERNRSGANRVNSFSFVERRRQCSRSAAARLVV